MQDFDEKLIHFAGVKVVPFARFALFFVYFYFGLIKVFFESGAANPLVMALSQKTLPFISPDIFLTCFGVFEMIIGLLFIVPKVERLALSLLFLHLITTIMPLFVLPDYTWQSFLLPTIEGQYILKNVLIVALGMVVLASLRPLKEEKNV